VPGEESAKTQPFPTRRAPFAKQGFSADDVIDFTPEVKAAAPAESAKYRPGPLYTPPSVEGTVVMPGVIAGAGWGGASVDAAMRDANAAAGGGARGARSLPINKPPYGTMTAIDLNTGDTKWTVPIGDSPDVRNHPALAGVSLPATLGVAGSPGSLVTKGGLVFSTGGGRVLYALDSRTGATLWEFDLGQVA